MPKPKRCHSCGLMKYDGRNYKLGKESHGLWTCDECIKEWEARNHAQS